MEDVARRGDRVGAEQERAAGPVRAGDQTEGQGRVAGDVAVGAGRGRGGLDLEGDGEVLGRLAVVPARAQRGEVGGEDVGLGAELRGEELLGRRRRARVHPGEESECEHVLRPLLLLAGQGVELRERLDGDRGQRQRVHVPGLEGVVVDRAGAPADLLEVAGGELVGVDDDRRATGDVGEVGLEGGRVHRDEDVGGVAGGEDVPAGEVQLEGTDARHRPLGGADLGGEVRQRGEVVAQGRAVGGEPVTRQLHPVAGVAGEADDDAVLDLGRRAAAHGGWSCPLRKSVRARESGRLSIVGRPNFRNLVDHVMRCITRRYAAPVNSACSSGTVTTRHSPAPSPGRWGRSSSTTVPGWWCIGLVSGWGR